MFDFNHYSKIFHATFIFAHKSQDIDAIAKAVGVSGQKIYQWSRSQMWDEFCVLHGCRGDDQIHGLEKYRRQEREKAKGIFRQFKRIQQLSCDKCSE